MSWLKLQEQGRHQQQQPQEQQQQRTTTAADHKYRKRNKTLYTKSTYLHSNISSKLIQGSIS